ncbi:MAG: type II secretion system minor pseudopilin GspK [Pseudomonadota bacterium]|nr:type II secretion system minor pseudopilin GspK [Pseudomonadota bacterium]
MKFLRRQRQRGVAVITALLLTTLAITIVASLFWQQQVQVRSMENQRLHLQIQWILRGTLDWTKLILQQEARTQSNYASLKDVWAVPLANTRIDQYVDRERVAGESFDANLSGQIFDAQGRYNLTNLALNGTPVQAQILVFKQLLTVLQLDPALAAGVAQLVASSQEVAATASQGPTAAKLIKPLELEDCLDVQGFTVEMLDKLRKFAVVLPDPTDVNVNTAPAEVLAAVLAMPLSTAQAVVTNRDRSAWNDLAKFKNELLTTWGVTAPLAGITINTEWFLVQSWLKLDRASLNTEALINRKTTNPYKTDVIWVHQN